MGTDARVYAAIHVRTSGSPDLGASSYAREDVELLADQLVTGTGDGQADTVFTDTRTLSASASEELDLSGSLEDPLGGSAVFAEVVAVEVRASADNTNDVVVGGASSNAWVGPFGAADNTFAVPPGGVLVFNHPGAGWAVTAGTGDLLQVENGGSGTAVTYDIVVVGRSA